ncbi:MAG TPA: MFS transporter [Candidatus Binatia bacterium]|nr:MFS transporter [Candidatus Binatia bacterium]
MKELKPIELPPRGSDTAHALAWGIISAGALIAAIMLGSRDFRDFDPALVSYAGASVFAAFGLGYRYAMWLRRPPTRLYWFRGWQIFLEPSRIPRNLAHLARIFWNNVVLQRFIEQRSKTRWTAHWFLAWGCLLAAAVTFPLSFGWIRFETAPHDQQIYRAFVFGVHVASFPLDSIVAPLAFNILDISAVMVLIGVFVAMWRRGRDRGAMSVQQFSNDLLPLILLFAISVTGLFLTASTHLMRGLHYVFLSQLHAATVIFTLLYLPFGKFFHIFQRPAQLGIDFYRRAGEEGGQARCIRCGQGYASQLQVADLKAVQGALGIRYQMEDGRHYQDVCPQCRRKNLALTQDALWRTPEAEAQRFAGF